MIKRHFSQHILHRNKQVVLNSHLLLVFLKMEGDGGVLISPSKPQRNDKSRWRWIWVLYDYNATSLQHVA